MAQSFTRHSRLSRVLRRVVDPRQSKGKPATGGHVAPMRSMMSMSLQTPFTMLSSFLRSVFTFTMSLPTKHSPELEFEKYLQSNPWVKGARVYDL